MSNVYLDSLVPVPLRISSSAPVLTKSHEIAKNLSINTVINIPAPMPAIK